MRAVQPRAIELLNKPTSLSKLNREEPLMPPFAQAQPFELAREIEVLTREPSEVQPPHWGWRTVGGHRDIKTGEVSGMVPSPHYWLAPTPEPEPLAVATAQVDAIGAIFDAMFQAANR